MRTMRARWIIVAILPLMVLGKAAVAEDVRPAMETANAQFLAAFNTPNPSAFLPLYTKDSVLYFQGAPPVAGPEAIKRFWESRIKAGVRDHTNDIIETGADGKYAFQVSRATVQLVGENGEKTLTAGHTVRIFERQSDGTWKTKTHMFNRPSVPSALASANPKESRHRDVGRPLRSPCWRTRRAEPGDQKAAPPVRQY